MTKISRSIQIATTADAVWQCMDLRRWQHISSIFAEVQLVNADGVDVGSEAKITAGPGVEKVRYTARVTALEPEKRLSYQRSGGPLPGTSEWELAPNALGGTEVRYHNSFNDDLDKPVQRSMIIAMDRFLADMKLFAESGSNGKESATTRSAAELIVDSN